MINLKWLNDEVRAVIPTRVALNDSRAKNALLEMIPVPIYYDHAWRCKYDEDEDLFPKSRGVRMETKKRKYNDDGTAVAGAALSSTMAAFDFRAIAFSNPTACQMLGLPNEIEYSANVIFGKALKLPHANESAYIYSSWRDYYTIEVSLFYNNSRVSYNYPPLENMFKACVALRVTRRPDVSPTSPPRFAISAKLKTYKRNILVGGKYKITLTGAIEVPYRNEEEIALPVRYDDEDKHIAWFPRGNKSVLTTYWGISFTLPDGNVVLMRVAFRQPAMMRADNLGTMPIRVAGSETKCNIECESNISGELYVRLLRILYLYYRDQYERFDGVVLPYRHEFTPDSVDELNAEDRDLARTYKQVPWHNCEEEEETEQPIDDDVSTLVRLLGLVAYANYDPRGEIRCSNKIATSLSSK